MLAAAIPRRTDAERADVTEPGTTATAPRVFVSYAPDSAEHERAVREFATFLRTEAGIDARLDAWYTDRRRDWASWVVDQLGRAEFVLAIASPRYRHLVDGGESAASASTKVLEAAMIRDNLVRNLPEETRRILPVVLPGHDAGEIPACLCGHSTTHYAVGELTLAGVRDLLAALAGTPLYRMPPLAPFTPPAPGVDPVIAGVAPAGRGTANILTADAELELGRHRYLVHADTLEVRPAPDGGVTRQARALRLGPRREYVWLKQAELRTETPAAKAVSEALLDEHRLLGELRGGDPGFPAARELVREPGVVTAVSGWPAAGPAGGPCGTLAEFVPHRGEPIDPWRTHRTLAGLAGLCRTLALLHARGVTHRSLTPAGLIRFDDGKVVLRDLGLATTPYRPGEAAAPYQAAEQRVRSSAPAGPWTDVYRLAAVAYHLVTGFPPDPAIPVPVRGFAAGLPERTAEAIDAALAADPARRPGLRAFAGALRATRDHRP